MENLGLPALTEEHTTVKRQASATLQTLGAQECSKHAFDATYQQLGWPGSDVTVIAPNPPNFKFCHGHCRSPYGGNHEIYTRHAEIIAALKAYDRRSDIPSPCCVPTQLNPMSLIYERGGIISMTCFQDVGTCGCVWFHVYCNCWFYHSQLHFWNINSRIFIIAAASHLVQLPLQWFLVYINLVIILIIYFWQPQLHKLPLLKNLRGAKARLKKKIVAYIEPHSSCIVHQNQPVILCLPIENHYLYQWCHPKLIFNPSTEDDLQIERLGLCHQSLLSSATN